MRYTCLFLYLILIMGCRPAKPVTTAPANQQAIFWAELQKLCGRAYAGEVVAAPANDTTFKNKLLLMHVRACNNEVIRIPFMVGEDRSRTWVFSRRKESILLKHDHRHRDGTADSVTQYGGYTTNAGSATVQVFPADAQTVSILPAAFGNVWWVELKPGEFFTYNLRRMGTDQNFSIRFNLQQTVPVPPAPWGWQD
jgi:hypothetical protein